MLIVRPIRNIRNHEQQAAARTIKVQPLTTTRVNLLIEDSIGIGTASFTFV
jgi:hypothetical protein